MLVTVVLDQEGLGGTGGRCAQVSGSGARSPPRARHDHHGDRLAPAMLLAADRQASPATATATFSEAQPVEASGGLFVAGFRREPDGGEVGDQQEEG